MFSANSAFGENFGIYTAGTGGGIENSGTLTVTSSAFTGNSATVGYGGGIDNDFSGTLAVTSSAFTGNSATGTAALGYGYGGGIENGGSLTVSNSTFSHNSASGGLGRGGGIDSYGTLSVINSTLSGNSAMGSVGVGGGIADSGTASLADVTVADNSAVSGGGIATQSLAVGQPTHLQSIDSIFQNPQGGNFAVASSAFSSLGHNLFSDDPSVSLDPTDLVNTDPLLGPLANNGGPTLTQALLPGSPAINAGIPVAGVTTDQRGAPRPLSGATDIGAFEVQPPLAVVSLQRSGTDRPPTVLVLAFNLPLDPIPANSLANYRLVKVDDGRVIPIRSAQYDAASESVTLRPKTRLSSSQTTR